MNANILKKCLTELSKEEGKPNIDYVRGMLETLIAVQTQDTPPLVKQEDKKLVHIGGTGGDILNVPREMIQELPQDEQAILDAKAAALVAKLKADSERMNQ